MIEMFAFNVTWQAATFRNYGRYFFGLGDFA